MASVSLMALASEKVSVWRTVSGRRWMQGMVKPLASVKV
jgi:hypothetical protein